MTKCNIHKTTGYPFSISLRLIGRKNFLIEKVFKYFHQNKMREETIICKIANETENVEQRPSVVLH